MNIKVIAGAVAACAARRLRIEAGTHGPRGERRPHHRLLPLADRRHGQGGRPTPRRATRSARRSSTTRAASSAGNKPTSSTSSTRTTRPRPTSRPSWSTSTTTRASSSSSARTARRHTEARGRGDRAQRPGDGRQRRRRRQDLREGLQAHRSRCCRRRRSYAGQHGQRDQRTGHRPSRRRSRSSPPTTASPRPRPAAGVAKAKELGFEVRRRGVRPQQTTDVCSALTKIKPKNPDVIIGSVHLSEGIAIVKQVGRTRRQADGVRRDGGPADAGLRQDAGRCGRGRARLDPVDAEDGRLGQVLRHARSDYAKTFTAQFGGRQPTTTTPRRRRPAWPSCSRSRRPARPNPTRCATRWPAWTRSRSSARSSSTRPA